MLLHRSVATATLDRLLVKLLVKLNLTARAGRPVSLYPSKTIHQHATLLNDSNAEKPNLHHLHKYATCSHVIESCLQNETNTLRNSEWKARTFRERIQLLWPKTSLKYDLTLGVVWHENFQLRCSPSRIIALDDNFQLLCSLGGDTA